MYIFNKKSKNILLFLLRIEIFLILLSLHSYMLINIYIVFILMIGVIEAVIGLTLLVNYTRFFGDEFLRI